MTKGIAKYVPFFTSAMLMCAALLVIYPHYQYYVDPDGTAYLTIAKRYATGDYANAINGYWSPWSCWLTALVIKMGWEAIPASVMVNAAGCVGLLYVSQSFFLRFGLQRRLQWLLSLTLSLFMCYAVFWQSFDDLWECFFLLGALRMMLADNFIGKPYLWVIYGMIGALAYFAKSYSFPFFILNTICCLWVLSGGDKMKWLTASAISVLVMVANSTPWIWLLHDKYGIWTTSTAGALNTSWYLVGHPEWKKGIDCLLPPPYQGSPYYWEDPYLVNGATPHFWTSGHLFIRQILKMGQNLYKFFVSGLQLSVFFPLTLLLFGKVLKNKEGRVANNAMYVVALSLVLFPLGYVLVNFESRYIWYMVPPAMLMGALFFQNLGGGKGRLTLLAVIFAVSFLVYPAWMMGRMYDEGKDEYRIAQQLKALNIHGSFTGIATPGVAAQRLERIAYFSGSSLYSIPKQRGQQEILKEMKHYGVKYYFAYDAGSVGSFTDEHGTPFPDVTSGAISGLKVFVVK